MVMSEGAMWKKHRRIVSRPFNEQNLDRLVPMIISLGEDLVGKLKQEADSQGVVMWRPVEDVHLLGKRVAAAVYMGETNPLNSKYALFSPHIQAEVREYIMDRFAISLKPTRIFYYDRLLYRLLFPGVREFYRKWRSMNAKLVEDIRLSQEAPRRSLALPHNPSPPVMLLSALVDCKVAGKSIKAGTKLMFPVKQILKKSYVDGDEFRPERWLVPDGHSIDERQRDEFLGFGFGPRRCPGQLLAVKEVIIIIAILLRSSHKFYGDAETHSPKFSSRLTMCPQDSPVRLHCRTV
ncbi:cytochrome p450, putative [Perkinsus marinus ATCC 50983]|uniref:Cytochrome p450, putative n=1 Tax=Perkinsus marinus (strain ATCC 50983 / TXsc) TaxID=423536 RepID=C5LAL1_PERM5|nr:cytochrome p450, putative [Perkinsus marinus ATCC 50983]EER06467.1 cytochrome p450, putative [Perkinsus marinus ATCC 50983]|eukprot:XP_002774651.1 cytochrome p450, putative [Perkinsus marinus ATCC 50983]